MDNGWVKPGAIIIVSSMVTFKLCVVLDYYY
mgnify:CR=1 FL=1